MAEEEEKNSIDNIFSKKLKDYTPSEELEKGVWNAIDSKLVKSSFYNFQLSKFNIYYCGLIVVSTAYTLFSISNHFISSPASHTPAVKTNELIDSIANGTTNSINNTSTTSSPSRQSKEEVSRKQKLNNNTEESSTVSDPLLVPQNEVQSIKDTVTNTPVEPIPVQKEKPVETKKPKTIRYVYQKDTIVQYDTVDVKKKKKKK